jgi:hypothetical protein
VGGDPTGESHVVDTAMRGEGQGDAGAMTGALAEVAYGLRLTHSTYKLIVDVTAGRGDLQLDGKP